MYLTREEYNLHGLGLVGVRSVLGVNSKKGSPFNVQRSIHIPNLTFDEVQSMFHDYQWESGQKIEPEVVQNLYEATNGQPGLIGWFGELFKHQSLPFTFASEWCNYMYMNGLISYTEIETDDDINHV